MSFGVLAKLANFKGREPGVGGSQESLKQRNGGRAVTFFNTDVHIKDIIFMTE